MVERVYKALLAGASAEEVLPEIGQMPCEQREMLFCMLSGIRNELAVNCVERAVEVDRVLGAPAQKTARAAGGARKCPA